MHDVGGTTILYHLLYGVPDRNKPQQNLATATWASIALDPVFGTEQIALA